MHASSTYNPQPLRLSQPLVHWMVGLFAALLLLLAGFTAQAAPPPAGTSITNQASLSYLDTALVTQTVLSNTVTTTVLQVASLTLTANGGGANGALNGTPGSVVYFPHTLTNTGNGTDTFSLTTNTPGTGAFLMTGVQIFLDNGSGLPTGSPITVTPALLAGGVFKFIVAATLPPGATAGQTNLLNVTATSVFNTAINAVNTDTTTVVTGANITLTKAINISSGPPGSGPYTYTITYQNIGNATATAVAITDVLPAGMVYALGSARWSVSGATALSDTGGPTGTSPNTITSNFTGGNTLTFTLNQVVVSGSGTLTFNVNVPAGTPAGVRNNTATASYTAGAATLTATSASVPFTVNAAAALTFVAPAPVTTATAGSVVSFNNVLTNTGTATDTFNISIQSNNFPAGTTFQLFNLANGSLLTDTNGAGGVDTGPVLAGNVFTVVLRATLPANAPASATPVSVTKRATSSNTTTVFADAVDTLNAVTAATVDLTNDSVNPPAGTLGAGPGGTNGEATAQKTNPTNAGTTTTFTLVVRNGGTGPDNYNLLASTTANHSALTLPAGWAVNFKVATGPAVGATIASCTSTGTTVTNTGNIAVGANAVFCAEVSVPAGFAAGDVSLFFRALSPASLASDIKHDRVTVNAVRSLSLTPNGTNQTTPGGTVVYPHTLTNTGNANEGNGTLSTITLSMTNSLSWTSTVHYDANGNGVIDIGENPITTINGVLPGGLAPGISMALLVRVNAAAGATAGQVNITTLTATTANGPGAGGYITTVPAAVSATDTTTIVTSNPQLLKEQALDANCDGTPDVGYAQTAISALPNGCVLYRITATNVGGVNITGMVITDATPTFTKISTLATATAPANTTGVTNPGVGGVGGISTGTGVNAFTLTPGQNARLFFGVRIDN